VNWQFIDALTEMDYFSLVDRFQTDDTLYEGAFPSAIRPEKDHNLPSFEDHGDIG
jgi:hypothetical protein